MSSVLILGANSDVGISLAHHYAKNKSKLLLAGRSIDKMAPLKSDLEIRYGADITLLKFDALDFISHEKFFTGINQKLDIAICVFGYLGDQKEGESNWTETKKIIDTNYSGAVSILNIIANDFESRKKGAIVGISSVAGDRGRQSNYLYGSAKAGFTAYLSGLRNRLFKNGVTVLTVKPGFIETKMTEGMKLPPKLTADPDKLAIAIDIAIKKKKNILYYLGIWRVIMLVVTHIPEGIFKKMKL